MSFWIAATLLSIPVLWYLLSPLWHKAADRSPARKDFDIRLYKDQLKEVERDLDRAVLGEEQAAAARLEIQRRLLAADKQAQDPAAPSGLTGRTAKALFVLTGAAMLGGTVGVYLILGAPGIPDMPLAGRADDITGARTAREVRAEETAGLQTIVVQLRDHIAQNPDDGTALEMLGSALMRLKRPHEAAMAYDHAARLLPDRTDIAAMRGEALIYAAQGTVTDDALAVFEHVVQQAPGDPRANYYIGLAAAQSGDAQTALARWTELLAAAPADAPWVEMVRTRLERLAQNEGLSPPPVPAPDAADLQAMAALDPEERRALIEGMVARLADRLDEDPSDLEGWGRLLRAYQVMGRLRDAHKAFETAMAAHSDNPGNQARLTQMGRQFGVLR